MSAAGVRATLRSRYRRWLDRRIPPSRRVVLDQRRVFIFPSRQGMSFLIVIAAILVAAVNYENNMLYGSAFLLVAMFVSTIIHTYANLSGLEITAMHARDAFAGEDAEFNITLSRQGRRQHHGLVLGWPGGTQVIENVLSDRPLLVKLFVNARRRGYMSPGRLRIETLFPLGFLRAWTWVDLGMHCLVYPRPLPAGALPRVAQLDDEDGIAVENPGADEFAGFRDYQPGDSLRSVHWRSLAKGQPLKSKVYSALTDTRLWLDWNEVHGDTEQKLSQLCYWVIEAAKTSDEYGLRLPGKIVAPNRGDEHKQRLLRELALFGLPREPDATAVTGGAP